MKSRLWYGTGVFPPGGWDGSPYRFLEYTTKAGSKVEADFWRELLTVYYAVSDKRVSVGALLNFHNKRLRVSVWHLDNCNLRQNELEDITQLIRACCINAGYDVAFKPENRKRASRKPSAT